VAVRGSSATMMTDLGILYLARRPDSDASTASGSMSAPARGDDDRAGHLSPRVVGCADHDAVGGSVSQWAEELTGAVLEHGASGFILFPAGDGAHGSALDASEWIEITQERIDTFADATGDHQWIHTDPDRAKDGPFGTPIAHGFLTLSLTCPAASRSRLTGRLRSRAATSPPPYCRASLASTPDPPRREVTFRGPVPYRLEGTVEGSADALENIGDIGDVGQAAVRPETLLLALLGDQVLGRDVAVSTGSVIAALNRLGVGEHATRATVARMVRRELLRTVRRGREAFLALTPRAVEVLRDGLRRLEAEIVDQDWDGRLTLLAFSVPETRRADRHALRTRLGWMGFAPLRSGLWVSPRATDVWQALSELDLLDHAEVFRAEAALWTDPARIAREAWDLPAIAAGYRRFLDRWSGDAFGDLDGLSRRTLLTAEWLLLIRQDPRLPRALLPRDWPGVRAQELFRALQRKLAGPADELAGEWLTTIAAFEPKHLIDD
jgi:DNA-binding transcriptional regulator PaaX/acyl dehydratase